jgi:hypothetical protein
MEQAPGPAAPSFSRRAGEEPLRVAYVGPRVWLEGSAPPTGSAGSNCALFPLSADGTADRVALREFGADLTVVFDPVSIPSEALAETLDASPGRTLGIITDDLPEQEVEGMRELDRLLSFRPSLSGVTRAGAVVWRAIPPPVSDALYGPVRPLHGAPRAMSIGRFTTRREQMLLPAKHHHDLLQVIHGLSGPGLRELLETHDVGVHAAGVTGAGFPPQAGIHLAAGQLLMSEPFEPGHGLEIDIDYLQFDSGEALVWMLDRLARFPEMHQRVRVRGRMKAEQYRASRLFARIAHDLLADVAAFG